MRGVVSQMVEEFVGIFFRVKTRFALIFERRIDHPYVHQ